MAPAELAPGEEISLDSPLRTHSKRGLPQSLSSTYPHGHVSGLPRSAAQQRAFEGRKVTIMRTMKQPQIEIAYWEVVDKIKVILEEDRKKNEEIDRAMNILRQERELERRVFWKMMEKNGKKSGKEVDESIEKDRVTTVKEEGEP